MDREKEMLEKKRATARKNNPRLAKIVEAYYQETKDQEFLDYMQIMVDRYMMHECKRGRLSSLSSKNSGAV